MQYEYFGPQGERRSREFTDQEAAESVGDRVICGFDVVQRDINARGQQLQIIYFQSEVTGKVWALYF